MAAEIVVAPSLSSVTRESLNNCVVLEGDGKYWFLYSYFQAANLPHKEHELIDLYSDSEISGYQLDRLIEKLSEARADTVNKPDRWEVVIGWNDSTISKETELRSSVERVDMIVLIDRLLSLANEARERGLKLVSIGD